MRTFGEGITQHFMQPYNFKVWGIDPARMSSDWIDGRVLTPSLDEVIEGALAARPGRHGAQRPVRLPAAGRLRDVRRRPGRPGPGPRRGVRAEPDAGAGSTPSGGGRPSGSRSPAAGGPAGDDRLRDALPERPAARPDRRHRRRPGGRPPGRRPACRARRSSASTWGSTARRSPRSTGSTTPRGRTSTSSSGSSCSPTPRRSRPRRATAP